MNRERMLLVRQAILEHPAKFIYEDTIASPHRGGSVATAGEILDDTCGTCGCIAGFSCALFNPGKQYALSYSAGDDLGLSDIEKDFLFFCIQVGWDDEPIHSLGDGYDAAIERIDFLLARDESLS